MAKTLNLYSSHLGGYYTSEEFMMPDDLYCETCGEFDQWVGEIESIDEAVHILYDERPIVCCKDFIITGAAADELERIASELGDEKSKKYLEEVAPRYVSDFEEFKKLAPHEICSVETKGDKGAFVMEIEEDDGNLYGLTPLGNYPITKENFCGAIVRYKG